MFSDAYVVTLSTEDSILWSFAIQPLANKLSVIQMKWICHIVIDKISHIYNMKTIIM